MTICGKLRRTSVSPYLKFHAGICLVRLREVFICIRNEPFLNAVESRNKRVTLGPVYCISIMHVHVLNSEILTSFHEEYWKLTQEVHSAIRISGIIFCPSISKVFCCEASQETCCDDCIKLDLAGRESYVPNWSVSGEFQVEELSVRSDGFSGSIKDGISMTGWVSINFSSKDFYKWVP
jgi:hypothetical protein